MPYVSELIGRSVVGINGERIGQLADVVASLNGGTHPPRIAAILVKSPRGPVLVPYTDVVVLVAPAIPLSKGVGDIVPYRPAERDLYLVRDVLDKQIIDTNGVRVVRVNDVELARVNGSFYVANVDIGGLGLLRRLGLANIAQRLAGGFRRELPPGIIAWSDVELLPGDQPIRLKVSGDKITDLHPADLAEIISDLTRSESGRLLDSLDVETVADTLEEVEPEFQASLIETMADERVADVLEAMAPDEAADLLNELPDDRSEELLKLMEHEDAEDVRRLLAYPDDTAGGVMNTEYVSVRPNLTAEQAICTLRDIGHEAETIYYVYIVDDDDRLVGVLSLRELVLAQPDTPLREIMEPRVVSVNLRTPQDDIARVVAKYNLLAVPVVDSRQRMQGIVTADDALDKIIPTAWKKRLPRMYR